MPRLDKTNHQNIQQDSVDLTAIDEHKDLNVVPNSFSEWLAQPASTISDSDMPEQGILLPVVNECPDTSFLIRQKNRAR